MNIFDMCGYPIYLPDWQAEPLPRCRRSLRKKLCTTELGCIHGEWHLPRMSHCLTHSALNQNVWNHIGSLLRLSWCLKLFFCLQPKNKFHTRTFSSLAFSEFVCSRLTVISMIFTVKGFSFCHRDATLSPSEETDTWPRPGYRSHSCHH